MDKILLWLRSRYNKLVHFGMEPKFEIPLFTNSRLKTVSKSNFPVTAFKYSSDKFTI